MGRVIINLNDNARALETPEPEPLVHPQDVAVVMDRHATEFIYFGVHACQSQIRPYKKIDRNVSFITRDKHTVG